MADLATARQESSFRGQRGARMSSPRVMAQDLWSRYQVLCQQRLLFDNDYQNQVELLSPGSPDVIRTRLAGTSRTERLFDTTAVMASQTLAANIMGAVTNQAVEWERLRFRDDAVNDDQEVSQWLAACDDRMMTGYSASNFYQSAHTYYLNLANFGTAAMFVGRQRAAELHLRFRTLSTGSYVIVENEVGVVDTLYRTIPLTPRQLVQAFGESKVSRKTREQARTTRQMDGPKDVLHCVFPREESQSGKAGNRFMRYASVYMECDTKEVIDESGYEEFPFLVSRWETLSDTPYGFGPGHIVLPDVRTLNTLRELHLQQLILWVQPPLKVMQEGVIGNISLAPLALNVVRQMDALQPMEIAGRPDLVAIDQAELRKSIRDIYFVDALSGLPPPDAQQMTAYEVARRIEIMQRLMGPAFTRLLAEMLDPLADRVFGLLWRAGVLPPVPMQVIEAARRNRGQLDVEYEGPLARAQRGADVRAIQEVTAMTKDIAVASQQPQVWDLLDLDAMVRQVARVNGTPRHLVRDTFQVLRMRQARAQQQQALQQTEETRQNMNTIGRVAPVIQALQGQRAA